MTPREAFKIGFIQACRDMQLTGEKAAALVEKAAVLSQTLFKTPFFEQLKNTVDYKRPAFKWGLLSLLGGTTAGTIAGHMASPAVDADEVRKQELINELKHWSQRAKEHQARHGRMTAV
jgi:hypothetical protein